MFKYISILFFMFTILGCKKEIKNFKPTTKLEYLLKNKKLNNAYNKFRIDNPYLSFGIEDTESFKTFVSETTIKELISLTECENPTVRCFAFKALIQKDYPEIRKILFRHRNDEENTKEYSRCIELIQPVKSYMLTQLEPFAKTKYRFNQKEYTQIRQEFF